MEIKTELEKPEETNEYKTRKNIQDYILDNLNDLMFAGKQELLIYDTTLSKIAEYHQLKERKAHEIIMEIVRNCKDYKDMRLIVYDGTVLKPLFPMKTCSCGARYTTERRKCPKCG